MTLERLFYTLQEAELRTAALYEQVARDWSSSRPLADLFSVLAAEEKAHARQVELLQSVFTESADAFAAVSGAQDAADDFLALIRRTAAEYRRSPPGPDPRDMVAMAQALESHLAEVHRTSLVQVADERLKALFASLNLADESHRRKLDEFAAAL